MALDAAMLNHLTEERQVELLVNATPPGDGRAGRRNPLAARHAVAGDGVRLRPGVQSAGNSFAAGGRGMPAWRAPTGWACWWKRARLAFKLWTGCEVEREVMNRAVTQ